jgi:uncharacterized oxidoreductase
MANKKDYFKDKVVLVTGGTSGIGLSLVGAFHARGAVVRFCARSEPAIREVERAHSGSTGYVCDVTNSGDVKAMGERIVATDGHLDILVANVGLLEEQDFAHAPLDEIDIRREIELNLVAPILNVNRLLPLLRKASAPHLVMIGSGYGWSPAGRAPLYSASKAGIRSFVKALRFQLGPRGVHLMEVAPPTVDTPAVAHRKVAKISSDEMAALVLRGIVQRKVAVFAGQTRAIPLMLRLAPAILERLTGRS